VHPERVRIELLLAGGAGQASIGRKYGISHDSIHRHWKNHVTEERRAALIMGPVQRAALSAQVAEESASVLDHHRIVRAGLYQRYHAALEGGDNHATAHLAGRLTEVNNSIAKLTGQLATSPLVQNNTVNVFMHDPGFLKFVEDLAAALTDHPAARAAVLAKFEALERDESLAVQTIPLLEHTGVHDAQ
jgi:hypothetical protein